MTDILFNDLPKRVSLDALRTGQMHTIGKRQIYIGEREQDGTLRNLVVKEQQNDTASAIYYADAANFTRTDTGQTITMQNVWHMQSGSGTISTPPRFASASLFIPTMERPPRSGQRRGQSVPQLIAGLPDMKANYQRLRDQPDAKESELKRATATLRNQRIEIAERFSFPLMCFAVTMVAAPLAVKTRRGGRSMAFSTGLAIIVGYFVLRKIVEPEFPVSLPTTILLVQIPNLTLCALGALFLCRIDRT
jgi:lipopolysaccharide export LptBFGC system permease protein LptF